MPHRGNRTHQSAKTPLKNSSNTSKVFSCSPQTAFCIGVVLYAENAEPEPVYGREKRIKAIIGCNGFQKQRNVL